MNTGVSLTLSLDATGSGAPRRLRRRAAPIEARANLAACTCGVRTNPNECSRDLNRERSRQQNGAIHAARPENVFETEPSTRAA
jgi:hypothetical protein